MSGYKSTIVSVALVGAGLAACGDGAASESVQAPLLEMPTQFDIAESAARFVFDEAPVFPEDGFPAYGNAFVTQGYIYPLGFLDGNEGVNADGTPAYPEMVIGEWTCRGWFIGNGAHTVTGPWVITTQLYDFYDSPGYQPNRASGWNNLVSEGYEIADVGKVVRRPISGGTGVYRGAIGAVDQVLLGFNSTEGVNLRFTLDVDMNPMAASTAMQAPR